MTESQSEPGSATRIVGLAFTVLGAMASLVLMFLVGRRNQSSVLMVLFAGWITLPFLGLGIADHFSAGWSTATRHTLRGLMLVIPTVTVAVYCYVAFRPIPIPAAAPFLIVPLGSWATASVALAVARLLSQSTLRL